MTDRAPLEKHFMRDGWKEIGLPKHPEESIPIVQERDGGLDLLCNGKVHHLSERAGRKLLVDLIKFYGER